MKEGTAKESLKVNDRVRQIGSSAREGVVRALRTEVTASNPEQQERSLMVQVLWDTGTLSYFSPSALERLS